MNSKSGTSFLLGRKATFYEFGIWTFFEHGADVEGSWVEGVLEQPTFSAQYSLLFFCRIALFLTAQYAQRFIFWSLGHQALYTWAPAHSLAELPSHRQPRPSWTKPFWRRGVTRQDGRAVRLRCPPFTHVGHTHCRYQVGFNANNCGFFPTQI